MPRGTPRCRGRPSEPLPEGRRDVAFVTQRLVQAPRPGPVMPRRHLDECRAQLTARALCLRHQQVTHAALTGTGIDHEREDADDSIVVLETWERMERNEAQHLPLVVRDD